MPGLVALRVRLAEVPRYTNRYFGWWLLPLAVLGAIASRPRPVDVLSLVVFAWIATGALFFVLGHVSSIDVRSWAPILRSQSWVQRRCRAIGGGSHGADEF